MRYNADMGRRGRCVRYASLEAAVIAAVLGGAACTSMTDADYRTDVDAAIHASIIADLTDLLAAARDLQAAAPSRAWDPNGDAIGEMRSAWTRTRISYEHIEGAILATYPDIDASLDARYEESLAALGGKGDPYLFDDRGVTGMHAIERILYAHDIRTSVIQFESGLAGYQPPAYPESDTDAIAFKTQLVQRLIDDADDLRKHWQTDAIDVGAAYQGLVDLMVEQQEKVNLATTGAEESRYANITLLDLRNNLEGTQKIYDQFRDWIRSKSDGESSDSTIRTRFDTLATVYASPATDSLPAVPPGWSSDAPTPDNLATPFGHMWQQIHESVDPNLKGSVVFTMNQIASLLGFTPP